MTSHHSAGQRLPSKSTTMSSASSDSHNSAAYSSNSNVSVQESSAKTYFMELQKYLHQELTKEAKEGVLPQRAAARQKLSRLNNLQFHELATDVYDELIRRVMDNHKSFLSLRDDFHPRRNQARQKLATLVETRFKDLASDVYHELRRRYPQLHMMDDTVNNSATSTVKPQASQSSNIIPVKGTMNVETQVHYSSSDEDSSNHDQSYSPQQNPRYRHQHHPDLPSLSSSSTTTTSALTPDQDNMQSLDSLMADLGNMVKTPRPMMDGNNNYADIESMKYEYEMKIAAMTERINSLVMQQQQQQEQQQQYAAVSSANNSEDYKTLEIKYNKLHQEHQDQQIAVREVKTEMKQLIDEIKSLSDKNETLRRQNEKAENDVKKLTKEVKSWKRKYDTISMELRSFKATTTTTNSASFESTAMKQNLQNLTKELFIQPTAKGAIPHPHITEYQSAVDDLISTSHYSNNPSDVLLSMRQIVMACKSITTAVEYHERKVGLAETDGETLYGIKKRFSQALSQLLIASKQYAAGMGISPVSLVDAAAGNLSVTIVDLVKLLGLKSIVEEEEEEGEQRQNATRMSNGKDIVESLSINNSTNAAPIAPPRRNPSRTNKDPVVNNNNGSNSDNSSSSNHHHQKMDIDTYNPKQLSFFLKMETDPIISSIQSLLLALRSINEEDTYSSPQPPPLHLYDIISSITNTISDIVQIARRTFNNTNSSSSADHELLDEHKHQGQVILNELYRCNEKIIHIRDTSFGDSKCTTTAMVKRNLAQETYDIVKFIKELINLLEHHYG